MKHMPDVLLVVGAGLLAYGAWLIYPPAGFLTGGLLMLTAGVLTSGKAN